MQTSGRDPERFVPRATFRAVVVVLLAFTALTGAQGADDAELTKGIAQVQDGNWADAHNTLQQVVKRLSATPERKQDLAQAYLWLGIAYAQGDSERAGQASFREALNLDPTVSLAEGWPAKVPRLFEAAKAEGPPKARDFARSAAQAEQSCEAGDREGCVVLASLHYLGEGVPRDLARAAALYRKACDGGWADGCALLGTMAMMGEGVPKDPVRATALYKTACDAENAQGCALLSDLYRRGEVVAKDPARSAGLLTRACDLGSGTGQRKFDLDACVQLGMRYENGEGVRKDAARATSLYKKACDAKQGNGCALLGSLYFKGEVVTKDLARSADLFIRACDLGSKLGCSGCNLVAGAYELGEGVPTDPVRATALRKRACDGGVPGACHTEAERRAMVSRILDEVNVAARTADSRILAEARTAVAEANAAARTADSRIPAEARTAAPEHGRPASAMSDGGVTGGVGFGGTVGDRAVRVGGPIKEPKKVKDVPAVYPDIAKQARVQGIVILECTIDGQGRVMDAKVLRGIPLLDQAAIDAVMQWVYTPTLLNGVPVPLIMTVLVNFRLS